MTHSWMGRNKEAWSGVGARFWSVLRVSFCRTHQWFENIGKMLEKREGRSGLECSGGPVDRIWESERGAIFLAQATE